MKTLEECREWSRRPLKQCPLHTQFLSEMLIFCCWWWADPHKKRNLQIKDILLLDEHWKLVSVGFVFHVCWPKEFGLCTLSMHSRGIRLSGWQQSEGITRQQNETCITICCLSDNIYYLDGNAVTCKPLLVVSALTIFLTILHSYSLQSGCKFLKTILLVKLKFKSSNS